MAPRSEHKIAPRNSWRAPALVDPRRRVVRLEHLKPSAQQLPQVWPGWAAPRDRENHAVGPREFSNLSAARERDMVHRRQPRGDGAEGGVEVRTVCFNGGVCAPKLSPGARPRCRKYRKRQSRAHPSPGREVEAETGE